MGNGISRLLLTMLFSVACNEFDPLCSIHDGTTTAVGGFGSPETTTLLEADSSSGWLYPSKEELYRYYVEGRRKCSELLEVFNSSSSDPGSRYVGVHAGFNHSWPTQLQTHCRGNRALWDFSGMIISPFGPMDRCPTYSKCWFGLMSCGTPNIEKMNSFVQKCAANRKLRINTWSIRSLSVLMRVIGSEIVVPEQRYLTMSTYVPTAAGEDDDVIVAQYFLTRPRTLKEFETLSLLEVRLFEFYPGLLLNSSRSMLEEQGADNCQVVYLGWNEPRCSPQVKGKCSIANTCCGCEKQSFVYGTPVAVNVSDGSTRCIPNAGLHGRVFPPPLPLCTSGNSSHPGRWIASSLRQYGVYCQEGLTMRVNRALSGHSAISVDRKNRVVDVRDRSTNQDRRKAPNNNRESSHKLEKKTNHRTRTTASDARGEDRGWFEASGNPCSVRSETAEDGGQHYWFYAPYSCRYRFYTKKEAALCLRHRNISHIHLSGDSMSRDLLSFVTQFLGVKALDAAQLKRMTNDLKKNNLTFVASNQLRITESYYWAFDLRSFRIIDTPPIPDVVITNYALSHKYDSSPNRFRTVWASTEHRYWSSRPPDPSFRPKHLIFQGAKEMQGRRNPHWVANAFRQSSEFLRRNYSELGFGHLDEYLLSRGRYPHTYKSFSDGWHIEGTTRQMEVIVLMNMLCNDWYAALNATHR